MPNSGEDNKYVSLANTWFLTDDIPKYSYWEFYSIPVFISLAHTIP
jgi:hypothetical protein